MLCFPVRVRACTDALPVLSAYDRGALRGAGGHVHAPTCTDPVSLSSLPIRSLQVNVRVTTMDAELEFAIQPSTTGKQLFDQASAKEGGFYQALRFWGCGTFCGLASIVRARVGSQPQRRG